MNTDELLNREIVRTARRYFILRPYNDNYYDYMLYIGDQIVGSLVVGSAGVLFQGSFIPSKSFVENSYYMRFPSKSELEQSVKEFYMECLLNCRSNSFLRQVLFMDKDFKNYFDFIGNLLEDGPISKEAQMELVKNMTRELVCKKLSDYANQNTKLFNNYIDNLRKESR